MITRKKLGDVLVSLNMLTEEQLKECLRIQASSNMMIGEILVAKGYIRKEQLQSALEFQQGVLYAELSMMELDPKITNLISAQVARRHSMIPILIENNALLVAMADPFDIIARDDAKIITGYRIVPVMSARDDIERAIGLCYSSSEDVQKTIDEINETDFMDEKDLQLRQLEQASEDEVARAPIVKLVNAIMLHAVNIRASDIHIESFDKNTIIRCRIDGALREMMNLPKASHASIVTRIKILGGMDIAETRKPQDGRIESVIDGTNIDMRISVLPTVSGEKVVIRILRSSSILVTREQLGFSLTNSARFDQVLRSPEGIILLTGPTGSGKTTTLYTVLRELNKPTVNIITVEDPVEYKLAGINQVQVNAKAGLSFAAGLRSILRQDPDIVMVGEIRDQETAEIAVRAAITGHLVLSTIHTNDASSTISRLLDMGCEPFMVSSALKGVIAQRLVKKICPRCIAKRMSTSEETMMLGLNNPITLSYGTGCQNCNNTGYFGRQGIHEILVADRDLRTMITNGSSSDEIKERARETGMRTLADSAKELVLEGKTTIEEMNRVAFSLDD
ncbi:MAG: Flp pilus assembly complex ATPase component TadA [Clostridiales bacterium]|jgi:type IV pilus assembly protein PilB|nr:Flp pilus assembly complex ATPase component TadA [Clostridiales bacterium]